MNKLNIFLFSISIAVCVSLPISAKELPVVDLIQEYGLSDTNKVTATQVILITKLKPGQTPHIIEIEKNDIPLLLGTLRKASFRKDVHHKCLGDYNLTFYSDKGKTILNVGHKTMIQTDKGIYHLGNDFTAIMEKYLPQYYRSEEAK